VQLHPEGHWPAEVHADVACCAHVPMCQQRHEPPSQIEGADGPGGSGTWLHGVLTAEAGTLAFEPEQSHDWPDRLQVKPSPQSESAWQVYCQGMPQSFESAHDCPPSAPVVQTVAAPATQRVPAPQSESLWHGIIVWQAAPAPDAARGRTSAAQNVKASSRRFEGDEDEVFMGAPRASQRAGQSERRVNSRA
jgi:hypothetical protein